MTSMLLFVTGTLTGFIACFVFSRVLSSSRSGAIRQLEERLLKADQSLNQLNQQLEAQKSRIRAAQQEARQAREKAASSRTQLETVSQERDALKAANGTALTTINQLRSEKEKLKVLIAKEERPLRPKEDKATRETELVRAESPTKRQHSASNTKEVPQVAALSLEALLPKGSKGFAVFDLETTGFDDPRRIVEIALVCVSPDGRIVEQWESLVNPEREIPNEATVRHKIRNRDVEQAPKFEQISSLLAAKIDGYVLVAHNLGYDLPILQKHFLEYSNVQVNLGIGICTYIGFSGNPDNKSSKNKKLSDLLAVHGVAFDPALAHTAKGDTLPLAKALIAGLPHLKPSAAAVEVQSKLNLQAPIQPYTRAMLGSPWKKVSLSLKPGQIFYSTSENSFGKTDTPIRKARYHVEKLGLKYKKANTISTKEPPVFLLTTRLDVVSTKMTQARERQIPIVEVSQVSKLSDLKYPVLAYIYSED